MVGPDSSEPGRRHGRGADPLTPSRLLRHPKSLVTAETLDSLVIDAAPPLPQQGGLAVIAEAWDVGGPVHGGTGG